MNEGFKAFCKENKVHLYQIADVLGIRPSEFSVQYMRHKLNPAEEQMLKSIVVAIKERGTDDNPRVQKQTRPYSKSAGERAFADFPWAGLFFNQQD